MCGIVAYVGNKPAQNILMQGLRRLEYRGYDSAGILVVTKNKKLKRVRSVGNVDELQKKLKNQKLAGAIGIAHTRWATHGGVTEKNAHPHFGQQGTVALAHNGIIENYQYLKQKYLANHKFKSETDTEVLAHLIEKFHAKLSLKKSVEKTLGLIGGTYGLVVISAKEPDKIMVARSGSPLAIGLGKNQNIIASDATPILPHTRKIIYLDDGEYAEITAEECQIYRLGTKGEIDKKAQKIDWTMEQAQKAGFEHFMLKEIHDQPIVIMDAVRGRLRPKEGSARMGGFNMTDLQAQKIKQITLLACGTANYACMVGKYLFERLAQIPTNAEIGSEFRYRNPVIDNKTLVFSVSQSGETLDTLVSQREAKRKGARVRGIVNVVGSTIAREADGGTYIHAGPELSVASSKAFTNMLMILTLYAVYFGRLRKMSFETGSKIIKEIQKLPGKVNQILEQAQAIKKAAKNYAGYKNMLFLGRGINYPIALEGSHKLKELSYIHSEAYPAGEMKHGANALLDPKFPVVAIATKNNLYEKMISNLEEVKARKSPILAVATKGDKKIQQLTQDVIYVPKTIEILEPVLNVIPFQLLAYYSACELKRNVDQPRNLAKSVTVE
ncbi:MAG: glutamine--fructose-6-phosphate transaminase (isomerizing) [Candidatus Moranbacteria bacterium]|nr:glutamine--fructose-6-phosphate transaminase (isomerizing) [Candidatus Moranbacteria bacterium]